jgi:hypothetical protein
MGGHFEQEDCRTADDGPEDLEWEGRGRHQGGRVRNMNWRR